MASTASEARLVTSEQLTGVLQIVSSPNELVDRITKNLIDIREGDLSPADHAVISSLQYFKNFEVDLSPERRLDITANLSSGGMHNGAGLVLSLMQCDVLHEHPLLASAIYFHWSGGKFGFQFLPHSRSMPWEEYLHQVYELSNVIWTSTSGDPRRVLVGSDRDFYDALPDRFTVYRGTAGVSFEIAALGVCWTTRREIAEWFALRAANGDEEPIVLTARVRKDTVLLAMASEHEVAVRPRRARRIACRNTDIMNRPEFAWKPGAPYR